MLASDMLRRSAQRFPDKAAIICGAETLSYRALDARANQLANALLALGLPKGAKVAILSRNIIDYGAVFFGVARTGYVLVNVSVLYAPEELTFVLNKADTEVLIFDPFLAEKVEAVREATAAHQDAISLGAVPVWRARARWTISSPRRRRRRRRCRSTETDPFCMTYTGGTTGRPKGVLCSHRARNITAHTVMVEEAIDERDVVAIVTPLFHVAALNIMFQPAILAGATTVFITPLVGRGLHGATRASTASPRASWCRRRPARWCAIPDFDAARLRTWRKLSFAGAPMPDWVQRELKAKLPQPASDANLRPVRNGRDCGFARLVSAGQARRGRAAAVQCRHRGGRPKASR